MSAWTAAAVIAAAKSTIAQNVERINTAIFLVVYINWRSGRKRGKASGRIAEKSLSEVLCSESLDDAHKVGALECGTSDEAAVNVGFCEEFCSV